MALAIYYWSLIMVPAGWTSLDLLLAYFPSFTARTKTGDDRHGSVAGAIEALAGGHLSWARLNQTLHRVHEAGMSEGFYRYYFLAAPKGHPYPVDRVFPGQAYEPNPRENNINDARQFEWGLRRFIYDAMLYWGNFRQAYRDLRTLSYEEISVHFDRLRQNEERLRRRGKVEGPKPIATDSRYLISEMASRSYIEQSETRNAAHVTLAVEAFRSLRSDGATVTPEALRQRTQALAEQHKQSNLFELLYEETEGVVTSEAQVLALYSGQQKAFETANQIALSNTDTYLSLCSDLDVYVATSMRTRRDFREMADTCSLIFDTPDLAEFNLRVFDPTLSAAKYHEDKGIIECLMVKTCKIVVYFAQHRESLGKVSEYAMGLSLGKPVIVLCPDDPTGHEMADFYRNSHPLMRLVEFSSGIVNGAMVTCSVKTVIELIKRILGNRMEYDQDTRPGSKAYFFLRERLTKSAVRVVTDNKMLTETFWNNWHGES